MVAQARHVVEPFHDLATACRTFCLCVEFRRVSHRLSPSFTVPGLQELPIAAIAILIAK